ncbi:MAG: diguanylate cyclase [Negativicutes bacterium]|nr:diguanylate cyclase [Negativicutes bacterium]
MFKPSHGALRITLIYIIVGSLWILFSDQLVALLTVDPVFMTHLSIFKGWLFIALTGWMLYELINRFVANMAQTQVLIEAKNQELSAMNEDLTSSDEELRHQFDEVLTNEEAIRRQNILLTSLHETALGLMHQLEIGNVLRAIVLRAAELTGTEHAFIFLFNQEANYAERKIGIGMFEKDAGRRVSLYEGLVGEVSRLKRAVVLNDYSSWEHRQSGSFFDDIHANLQVPLKSGDDVVGTIGLISTDESRRFDENDVALIEQFAEIASLALANAQLHASLVESQKSLQKSNEELRAAHEELVASEEELRQQFNEVITNEEKIRHQNILLTSLHETALGLMHRLDSEEVLRMIVSGATELLNTPNGYISLLDEKNGVFIRKIGLGCYKEDVGRQIKINEGIIGQIYKTGEIVVIDDYSTWEKRLNGAFFDQLHSIVQVPLKAGGKVAGTFGLAYLTTDQKFTTQEIALLKQFAELASIALDNALLVTSYRDELLERRQTELELRKSQTSNQALINAIPDPMFIIKRDGTFSDYKATSEQLYLQPSTFLGKTVSEIFPPEIAVKTMQAIEITMRTGDIQIFEYQLFFHGKIQHYEARIVVSGSDEVLTIVRNITERKAMEEQLEQLSLHDALTGLYNRAFFEEEMKRIESARNSSAGLIVCDVDGLKIVNDTLGHNMGDTILKAVATTLKDSFRPGDLVSRIGGDEFAVLLPNNSTQALEADCRRIRDKIDHYNTENPTVPISLSIGFALSRESPVDMNALFKEADNNMYREKLHRQKSARSAIVHALMKALEARDFITEGHGERLQQLIESFATALGLPESGNADLRLLARFHDIGKVGIPDSILFKPGNLTEDEFVIMRQHCEIGYRIAKSAPDLAPIADWILKHQEWWNGNGYPIGLTGEDIPLECRMLGIADAFDAMTSDRPYRQAMSKTAAISELRRCAGTQFDPQLVEPFITLVIK